MKGFIGKIPIVVWIVVLLGIVIYAGYDLVGKAFIADLVASVTGECKNIYCADYEFICCDLYKTSSGYKSLTSMEQSWQCPLSAVRCELSGIPASDPWNYYYIGMTPDWCTGTRMTTTSVTLQPGEYIKNCAIMPSFTYAIWDNALRWCGDSSCGSGPDGIIGIPVQGASGCSFTTNWDIYNDQGRLVQSVQEGVDFQITVPKGMCYLSQKTRHVCGDTCESCSSDADCKIGHSFIYNNKGAECSTGQLQVYGCRQYGTTPNEEDRQIMPWEAKLNWNYGSKCDVVQTVPVQCCPGTDSCGPNAFCDSETFTCKSSGEVQCNNDWECGQSTMCTYKNNQPTIVGKKCSNIGCQAGVLKCCVDDIKQTVACCYDTDCALGYYCGADYKCYQQVQEDLPCPYDCCVNYPGYRDRPCPESQLCCPDNICKFDCSDLPPNERCNYNYECESYIGETIENCPDCEPGIWEYLKIFIGGLIASAVILGVLWILGMFVVPLRIVTKILSKPRNFVIVWIILALALTALFAIPMGSVYGSVIG